MPDALLIGGTAAAAHHDEDTAAAAIGFVAFGFYAGNIYGAANATAKHDRPKGEGCAIGLYLGC